jgi:GntR family transcriptional regulator, arabinose operon transcriptional repressor
LLDASRRVSNTSFKYLDLAQKLMRHIAVACLQPGDRLPTEEDLIREYGLSRVTVRRALSVLEKDGLVLRRRKRGTFVGRAISDSTELDRLRGKVIVAIPAGENAGDHVDYALLNLLRGLERFLADRGFTVQITSIGADDAQDKSRLLGLVNRGDLEGICAVGPCLNRHQGFLECIPHVNSCTFLPNALPWVGLNMEEVIYTSVSYMLERGHLRVAMICGPWIDSQAFAVFVTGYKRALEERSIPFHRTLIHHAYEGESLHELVASVLRDRCPTAMFAEDWRLTHAVLTACQELGLRIPNDLSLVGCGQNTQYVSSTIGITAYLPDNESVGHQIGRVLVDMIDEKMMPKGPVFVSGHLVERGSVAAPKLPDVDCAHPRGAS